jgi:NTE family protein
MDIATSQSRGLRKRALVADLQCGARKGAYWGIGTPIASYGLPDALPCLPKKTVELANLRTRLNEFTESEQCELINWGYALCDAALRRHVMHTGIPAPSWPYPAFALDR